MAVNKTPVTEENNTTVSVLRIGVVKNGQLIDERLVQHGEMVTIGSDQYNTFVLEKDLDASLGEKFFLFEYRNNTYQLLFTNDMKGHLRSVKNADENASIPELIQGKVLGGRKVSEKKGVYYLPFDGDYQGKIEIGAYSFLFQFVATSAVVVRNVSVQKDELFDEEDKIFLGFLGFFSVLAIVGMVWVLQQPRPELDKEEIEALLAEFLDVEPPEEETPDTTDEEVDEELPPDPNSTVAKEKVEEKAPDVEQPKPVEEQKKQVENRAQASENMSADRQAAAEAAVQNTAVFKMLGTLGNGATNVTASAFGSGDGQDVDLDALLDGVSDAVVATNDSQVTIKGQTDKSGKASLDVGVVQAGGGGQVNVGKGPKTVAPVSSTNIEKIESANGGCNNGVNSTVKKYISQIKACHTNSLKTNPSVGGRIEVDVEIEDGKVILAQVSKNATNDKELASCIERRIKRWEFPTDCSEITMFPFLLSAKTE